MMICADGEALGDYWAEKAEWSDSQNEDIDEDEEDGKPSDS